MAAGFLYIIKYISDFKELHKLVYKDGKNSVTYCSDVTAKAGWSIMILRVIHKLKPIVNTCVRIKGIKSND